MADSPVKEAGLFTVLHTSFPPDQLEQFATYRVGRVLNMVTPPVLFSFGVPGNLMTLLVLTRSAFRSNACCKYLAALALCDTLVLLLYFCFSFVDIFVYKLLSSDVVCKLYYFSFFTSAHLSAWLLVAVTMQRCLVVCRPMASRIVTSKRCTVCIIGGLTAASVTLNLHQLVIREVVWSDDTKTSVCHVQGPEREMFVRNVWPWLDATAYCFFPSLSVLILNILIFRALKKAAVFRKSLQCHRLRGQAKCVPSIKNRVKAEEDAKNLPTRICSNSLFVCEASESTSRASRSAITPQTDDPASPAWNIDSSVPEAENENSSSHCVCNHQQIQNTVSDEGIVSSTDCTRTTRGGLVSETYVGNDCAISEMPASSRISSSESQGAVLEHDSVVIFSMGTYSSSQHLNGWSRSSGQYNTQGLFCKEQTNESCFTQADDTDDSAVMSVENISTAFSHRPEEHGDSTSDNNDRPAKYENGSRMFGLLFNKTKKYDLKEKSMKLSRLPSQTGSVLGLSLHMAGESDVQTHKLRVSNRVSTGNQTHERESRSRQLTMMPLLASLVFLTLSAPLAVILVAEHTIWIRNTAEQVAVYTLARMVTNTLMYLNHSINFLLYCFAGSTFRRHCCSLLCRLCPCSSAARLSSRARTKSASQGTVQ
ncbi:hypothetical protein ACOMHN_046396 [Nucella lapillus]